MNATVIDTGKVNAVKGFSEEMSMINSQLIDSLQKLYGIELTRKQISKVCSMPYIDKIWLIVQYNRDIRVTEKLADLSNLH